MAKKPTSMKAEPKKVAHVKNKSTVGVTIDGVFIGIGQSEDVPNYDPDSKINKAFAQGKMITVK